MGHSFGSAIGILAVKQKPELYHAYIGIGQVTDMKEIERIAYKFNLRRAHETKNKKALQELEEIGPPPWENDNLFEATLLNRTWLTKL